MTICVSVKAKLFAGANNTFRRKALERAYEFLDPAVLGITYQVKMIRHYHVSNKLAWPLLIQTVEFFKESIAASRFSEDRYTIQRVASHKVQRAREIQV